MSWVYRVEESALRELRSLGPSVATEIFAYLDTRISGSIDPRQFGKPLRGPLKGFWRYRVRDYRIICRLEEVSVRAESGAARMVQLPRPPPAAASARAVCRRAAWRG